MSNQPVPPDKKISIPVVILVVLIPVVFGLVITGLSCFAFSK